jgi:hypothetical protein
VVSLMKYGPKYGSIRPRGVITRYCKDCKHHVAISEFTAKMEDGLTQKTCDYCLGVKLWEGDV